MKTPLRFTEEEANKAADEWGFNCGPAALCAVLNLTPAELRPHLIDFEQKGSTNPSLMFAVLKALNIDHRCSYRSDVAESAQLNAWPRFGLVRIQWGGPWTKPGVPKRVRYHKTHWVATRGQSYDLEVFDVNAMRDGGWLPFRVWSERLIPWLIKECVPKADGTWWPTHGIAITQGQSPTVS